MIMKCPDCRSFTYSNSKCSRCGYTSIQRQSIDALYNQKVVPKTKETSKKRKSNSYSNSDSISYIDFSSYDSGGSSFD